MYRTFVDSNSLKTFLLFVEWLSKLSGAAEKSIQKKVTELKILSKLKRYYDNSSGYSKYC